MSPDLTFWDYITLGLALIFVVVFSFIKIRNLLKLSSGGCGNCSGGGCGVQENQNQSTEQISTHKVSIASIQTKTSLNKNIKY